MGEGLVLIVMFGVRPGDWVMLVAADVVELRVLSLLKAERLLTLLATSRLPFRGPTYTDWVSTELS